jgi:hypothetical protein
MITAEAASVSFNFFVSPTCLSMKAYRKKLDWSVG